MKISSILLLMISYITLIIAYRGSVEYMNNIHSCSQKFYSCNSLFNEVCSCNYTCIYYDNCCFDASVITGKENNRGTVEDVLLSEFLERTTCEYVAFLSHYYSRRQGVFMVSSCPETWTGNNDTKDKCEQNTVVDWLDQVPVFDVKGWVTFKNRNCAVCHGIKHWVAWRLEITCSPYLDLGNMSSKYLSLIDEFVLKMQNERCSYHFKPPDILNVTVHYCYKSIHYNVLSKISDHVSNSTCENRVLQPIYVDAVEKHFYRNIQCVIEANYSTYFISGSCWFLSANLIKKYLYSYGLSSLIDISALLRIQQKVKCRENEVYLSDEIGCKRLYCPGDEEPSGGQCVGITQITSVSFITLDLLFEACCEAKLFIIYQTLTNIFVNVSKMLSNDNKTSVPPNWYELMHVPVAKGLYETTGKSCVILHIRLPIERNKESRVINATIQHERDLISSVFRNYYNTLTYSGSGKFVVHLDDVQNASCKTNISLRSPMYVLDEHRIDNDLPCPAVKVQYNTTASDGLVTDVPGRYSYFYLDGVAIEQSDIFYAREAYFVCTDIFFSTYHNSNQRYNMVNYREMINISCTSLSIIFLIYCLVQYCVIPVIRDGKSDLLLVLMSFLLLAQICFLVLPRFAITEGVCEWLGMVHHFVWLGTFTFMFACLFRFNAEIRDLKNYSKFERMFVTVKYVSVGLATSISVVVGTKLTNLYFAPIQKWYGGQACFLSHTLVLLIVFIVPILIIICGNIILIIFIIHYISSTSISIKSKQQLIVFIKLSTVMGFSWVIGIVAVLSQSEILLIIFEVLSNLQGAFITISFSCNNHVRKFYKDCIYGESLN